MKQFLLAGNVAYTAATDFNAVAAGALGVFYNLAGVPTVTTDGSEIKKHAMLVLGRAASKGGPISLPIYKNNFSFVKGEYTAATTFVATVTVVAPTKVGDHSIIVARKGVLFNERNKYTASVYITDLTTTATVLATKLIKAINANSAASGVSATNVAGVITITAAKSGIDYAIVTADNLQSITPSVTTKGSAAYGDAAYVRDLADKAAAESGFNYTFDQGRDDKLYPGYPVEPLASPLATDVGYTIFTIKFSEPREVKTVDRVVNQIIQVAIPTGATQIATFEAVLTGIAAAATVTVEEPAE